MNNRSSRQLTSQQVFTWMMVLSVLFLFLPLRWTDRLDHLFSALVGPFSQGSRQMTLLVTENLPEPDQAEITERKCQKLQEMLLYAEKQKMNLIQANRNLQETIDRLAGVRQSFGQTRAMLMDADVIASDSTNWRYWKKLNQGSLQQIAVGQIVLGPMGPADKSEDSRSTESLCRMCVVGRVNNVGLKYSSFQLISDAGFSLPVILEPHPNRGEVWRANGVLKVKSLGEITVTMVEVRGNPVHVGDSVLACSDPRYLPVETLIGMVRECQSDPENPLMWRILVEPAADLHSLDHVVVVNPLWDE
jgi:cell shape-determining protein MreC